MPSLSTIGSQTGLLELLFQGLKRRDLYQDSLVVTKIQRKSLISEVLGMALSSNFASDLFFEPLTTESLAERTVCFGLPSSAGFVIGSAYSDMFWSTSNSPTKRKSPMGDELTLSQAYLIG